MRAGSLAPTSLTAHEVEEVRRRLGREPTEVELAIFEATWSEHCSYKSSKHLLALLPTSGRRVVVGPGYDAGVVDVGEGYVVSIHIESHNHPSAIDPYGGAATGVGGVVRDILSVGTRPIALLNSLRFGKLENAHSKWLFSNVVRGIADYGNCIGVPTVAGEVEFNESFERNCLVDVVCIGVGRREELILAEAREPGSIILVVGNYTGRDGIRGASFASRPLDGEDDRSAVQIPDPFLEKLLIDATLEAVERRLLLAVKDLGGGGLATALAEIAYKGGAGIDADLSKVHLRESDMQPTEVLLSESQERMIFLVRTEVLKQVTDILEKYEVPFSIIGVVTSDRILRFRWYGKIVAEVPVWAAVEAPIQERVVQTVHQFSRANTTLKPSTPDLHEAFFKVLSSPNVASKRYVFEQYDHEVGVRTVVKPGDGDSAVLKLPNGRFLSVKVDGDPQKCHLDPYMGAMNVASEACRNIVCTGAEPIAAVDHLQFGNPDDEEVFWSFYHTIRGLTDYFSTIGVPIVGGKVSFYNEDSTTGRAIKPTPVIAAIGLAPTHDSVTTMSLKTEGDALLVIGETSAELGGSEYYRVVHGIEQGQVPFVDPRLDLRIFRAVLTLARVGALKAAHDCSRGGFGATLAEMCVSGSLGTTIDLSSLPRVGELRLDELLFSEGRTRIVVEVPKKQIGFAASVFERYRVPYGLIGTVGGRTLRILYDDRTIIEAGLDELENAFEKPIPNMMGG
jgi:phosphoribosylformylglycinamidine synthase